MIHKQILKWAQLGLQKKPLELLANYNILQHVIKPYMNKMNIFQRN